ncbi:MAG: P-type DNA transfer ATPase VirB11 [Steroidobacteraceae bacterium]
MTYSAAARASLAYELEPIAHLLSDPALTDLHICGSIGFVERGHGRERIDLPYSFGDLAYIARLAAAATGQDIEADVPVVSTEFPGGHRVHIMRPPAVPDGQIAFSIRRPLAVAPTMAQHVQAGTMTAAQAELITNAVLHRRPIVFSGLVGSGKTTLLRSAITVIPLSWRLVTIEDTREIIGLRHENVTHMLYSNGGQSVASTSAEELVHAAMRMGMDGLLLQEVRNQAAYGYLSALKSGHWTMTTTHADSAEDAFDRLAGLVKEHPAGMHLDEDNLTRTLRRSIAVIVHCERDGDRRYVREVWTQ